MALQKTITMNTGIDTDYHVISAVYWYPGQQTAHINVASYMSKAAFDAGREPVCVNQFEFTGDQCPFTDGASLDAAQNAILTTGMFSGAKIAGDQ